jgi:hypothetical protein
MANTPLFSVRYPDEYSVQFVHLDVGTGKETILFDSHQTNLDNRLDGSDVVELLTRVLVRVAKCCGTTLEVENG